MNKLIVALMCMIGSVSVIADGVTTNAYKMTMSLNTPTLLTGVRSKTAQTYKGYLYMVYGEDGKLDSAWADVVASKTKVGHVIVFEDGFYHLLGKTTAKSLRSVPNLYLKGKDESTYGGISKYGIHENIISIDLAGFGTLKSTKTTIIGCSACGEATKTTEFCNIINSANGQVVGVMDCECPDDEDWYHTVIGGVCGVWYDIATESLYERTHYAGFNGNWKITYDAKKSSR